MSTTVLTKRSDYSQLMQELNILAQKYPEGFTNLIQGLEESTIDGWTFKRCAYGKIAFGNQEKAIAINGEMMALLEIQVTPLECVIGGMHMGEPLNEGQQEFLELCREIQQLYSTRAIGSEQ